MRLLPIVLPNGVFKFLLVVAPQLFTSAVRAPANSQVIEWGPN